MNKVIACLFVALALGAVLVLDVHSVAPAWTIYMEWTGLILAFIAAVMYFMHHRSMTRGDDDGDRFED